MQRRFEVGGKNKLKLDALHITIERRFGKTEPQVLFTTERRVVCVDFLPVGVFGAEFVVQRHGLFEARVHHVFREGHDLGFARHQLLQSDRVACIIFGLAFHMGKCGSTFDDRLVFSRQTVVGLVVDKNIQLRTTLPPTWVVVKGRNFVKA